MDQRLDNLCDEIDAGVFSSDMLEDAPTRAGFLAYIQRWQRALEQYEGETPAEPDPNQA